MAEFPTTHPDDQFEFGLRAIKTAYKQRNDQLEASLVSLKQLLKDRELGMEDLKSRYALLENETLEWRDRYARLAIEKEAIQHENQDLIRIARDLRAEVDRLFVFKKAILETVGGDSSSLYPFSSSPIYDNTLSPLSQTPSPSLLSTRLLTENTTTNPHDGERGPVHLPSVLRRQQQPPTKIVSHQSEQCDVVDTFLGIEKEDDVMANNTRARGVGLKDQNNSLFTPFSSRGNVVASNSNNNNNQIPTGRNDLTSRVTTGRSRIKDTPLESRSTAVIATTSAQTKKESEKREGPFLGRKITPSVQTSLGQEEKTPTSTPRQILEQIPPQAPHKTQTSLSRLSLFEPDQLLNELQIPKAYLTSNTINGKSLESMLFHVVPIDTTFSCEDCILNGNGIHDHNSHNNNNNYTPRMTYQY